MNDDIEQRFKRLEEALDFVRDQLTLQARLANLQVVALETVATGVSRSNQDTPGLSRSKEVLVMPNAVPVARVPGNMTSRRHDLLLPASSLVPSIGSHSKEHDSESTRDLEALEQEPLLPNRPTKATEIISSWKREALSDRQHEIVEIIDNRIQSHVKSLQDEVARLSTIVAELEEFAFVDCDEEAKQNSPKVDIHQSSGQSNSPSSHRKSWRPKRTHADRRTAINLSLPSTLQKSHTGIGESDDSITTYTPLFRQMSETPMHEYDLAMDMWDAAVFVILKDFAELGAGRFKTKTVLQSIMVFISLVLTFYFQIKFIYWIAALVVPTQIHTVQEHYKLFHMVSFNDGHFDAQGFDSLGNEREVICQTAMSTQNFLLGTLFLWVTRCLIEFKSIYRQKRLFDLLPSLPSGGSPTQMVIHKDAKLLIICVSKMARLLISVCVFLPRIAIAFFLLGLGMLFLTSTQSYTDLVLNSIALEFVYDIDELFLMCFLPTIFRDRLQCTKISVPSDNIGRFEHALELSYGRNMVILASAFCMVWAWMHFQPVIPGYQYDVHTSCTSFLDSQRQIMCHPLSRDCFPK